MENLSEAYIRRNIWRKSLQERKEENWVENQPYGYLVLSHKDVFELLSDTRLVNPGVALLEKQGINSGFVFDRFSRRIVSLEGDDHKNLRRIGLHALSFAHENRVRAITKEVSKYLLTNISKNNFDVFGDYAEQIPLLVIGKLLGIDQTASLDFTKLATSYLRVFSNNIQEHLEEIENAYIELERFLSVCLREKKKNPLPDILSILATGFDESSEGNIRLLGLAMSFISAGIDTSRYQISQIIYDVLSNRCSVDLRLSNSEVLSALVHEGMRFSPVLREINRYVPTTFTYNGHLFEKGHLVRLSVASANFDPSFYNNALEFNQYRTLEKLPNFGSGRHYCIGANLARYEIEEAVRTFFLNLDGISLVGEVKWNDVPSTMACGPNHMLATVDVKHKL